MGNFQLHFTVFGRREAARQRDRRWHFLRNYVKIMNWVIYFKNRMWHYPIKALSGSALLFLGGVRPPANAMGAGITEDMVKRAIVKILSQV